MGAHGGARWASISHAFFDLAICVLVFVMLYECLRFLFYFSIGHVCSLRACMLCIFMFCVRESLLCMYLVCSAIKCLLCMSVVFIYVTICTLYCIYGYVQVCM